MHNETFYTNKNIDDLKIALISDIHYYYPNFNLKIFHKIIKQIKKNKPNYTCICGDILDESNYENLTELKSFLEILAKISPVIVILGNHDSKIKSKIKWKEYKNPTLIKILSEIDNLYYLEDSIYQDKNITFYGFCLSFDHFEDEDESYSSFKKEVEQLKCPLNNENYNITLFHSPINIYKYLQRNPKAVLNNSDIILSGHTHNGCLPFFFTHIINKIFKTTRSLVAPNRSLFPYYSQGRVYKIKDGFIYEGVTKLSKSTGFFHYFNFLFPVNVEFITIKKQV